MGIWRCDNTNKAGQQCILRQSHNGKVDCRFAEGPRIITDPLLKPRDPEVENETYPPAPAESKRRKMNKTETRYSYRLEALKLAGEIKSYEYEAITFRLADDCRYTPDFFVINKVDRVELHEVKGAHIWEDSKIKIRVAAAKFPRFTFYLAQYRAGEWTVTEMKI